MTPNPSIPESLNPSAGDVLWCFSGGRMRHRFGRVVLDQPIARAVIRMDGTSEQHWYVKPVAGDDLPGLPEFIAPESHLAATREELEQRFPVAPKAAPSVASSDAQLDLFAEAV